MRDRHTLIRHVLARHSVSSHEWDVLIPVAYRTPVDPAGIAAEAAWEAAWHGAPPDPFEPDVLSREQYLGVIGGCIAKGWLCVLREEDLIRDRRRRVHSRCIEPPSEDDQYQPGHLAFTPPGYRKWRQIMVEMEGQDHVDEDESLALRLHGMHRWALIGRTLAACQASLYRVAHALEDRDKPWVIEDVTVSEPERIGCWRPYRFISHRRGWRMEATFQLARHPIGH